MDIKDFYFHTISKFDNKEIYNNFESILKDGKLKSQKLLNNNEIKFNGLEYISLAEYVEPSQYKVVCLKELDYNNSKLSTLFDSYSEYLKYLQLDNYKEVPMTKDEYFKLYNTTNKTKYFNYLGSISRTYPVDIKYLFNTTNDTIFKQILDIINDDILYCNKSEYCFEEYIRNSKGITFVFPKSIDVKKVNIIPNMPFEVESKLVNMIQNLDERYSNQKGEVQVKDYLDISNAIGIIINDNLNLKLIKNIMKTYNYNYKIYKIVNNSLIEYKNDIIV